jgi:hypothetical protein
MQEDQDAKGQTQDELAGVIQVLEHRYAPVGESSCIVRDVNRDACLRSGHF